MGRGVGPQGGFWGRREHAWRLRVFQLLAILQVHTLLTNDFDRAMDFLTCIKVELTIVTITIILIETLPSSR